MKSIMYIWQRIIFKKNTKNSYNSEQKRKKERKKKGNPIKKELGNSLVAQWVRIGRCQLHLISGLGMSTGCGRDKKKKKKTAEFRNKSKYIWKQCMRNSFSNQCGKKPINRVGITRLLFGREKCWNLTSLLSPKEIPNESKI